MSAFWPPNLAGGTGSVTSVAMTVPTFLSVAGSPITTSGTLAVTLSGTALPILNGGTGQTTKAPAFNALSPMTTAGDLIYGGAAGAGTRLAVGVSGNILTTSGGNPTWLAPTLSTTGQFAVFVNSSYSNIALSTVFQPDYNTSWTVSWWQNVGATTDGAYLTNVAGALGCSVNFLDGSGSTFIYIGHDNTHAINVTANLTLAGTGWRLVTATYAGTHLASGVKIYLDGVSQTLTVAQDNLGTNSTVSTPSRLIGQSVACQNLGIYIGATLTQPQVAEIFNAGRGANLSSLTTGASLTNYYPFNGTSTDLVAAINGTDTKICYSDFLGGLAVSNYNSGATVEALLYLDNSSDNGGLLSIEAFSSSYSSSGYQVAAGTAMVTRLGSGGLTIGTANNSPLSVVTNNTVRGGVDTSGQWTIGSGTSNQHILNTLVVTNGAQVGTLTNSPVAGNPTGFIQITVNGGTHYIPYW